MCHEVNKITHWLKVNKVTLNLKKTNYMIFKSVRKKMNLTEEFKIEGETISKVEVIKFLGVYLDSNLTWKQHVKYIKGKVARGVGIITKAQYYLPNDILRTLYFSFVYPYLDYANEVWGCTFKSYLTPLLLLQKRVVRIISGVPNLTHTKALFTDNFLIPFTYLHEYKILLVMYKYYCGMTPIGISMIFSKRRQIHNLFTRSVTNLYIPRARTSLLQRSLRIYGPKIFNKWFHSISSSLSVHSFKYTIKKRILDMHDGVVDKPVSSGIS